MRNLALTRPLLAIIMFVVGVFWSALGFAQSRPERQVNPSPPSTIGIVPPGSDPRLLEVTVWTDKGVETPTYYVGERIYVSFSVTRDCYVVLYDIDSTGNVNILFPNPYHADNMVRAGRVYTVPTSNYKHDLFIKGPTGEEFLFAVASAYAYYHWQYGQYPPPVWSDEWGTPATWGHSGGPDNTLASRRFQQRLQFGMNLGQQTVDVIKYQTDQSNKRYAVTYGSCKFFVTISPY